MQIIMITHQAIIASKSDRHFYVRKTQDSSTNVNISILEGDSKLKAIAELASGNISEESLNLANDFSVSAVSEEDRTIDEVRIERLTREANTIFINQKDFVEGIAMVLEEKHNHVDIVVSDELTPISDVLTGEEEA